MSHVAQLVVNEPADVDQDELARVFFRMNPEKAEETFHGLIQSLTDHLAMSDHHLQANNLPELADTMSLVELISGRLCMTTLSQVATDVIQCCECRDYVALSATQARLIRVGECALREIWDLKRDYI